LLTYKGMLIIERLETKHVINCPIGSKYGTSSMKMKRDPSAIIKLVESLKS